MADVNIGIGKLTVLLPVAIFKARRFNRPRTRMTLSSSSTPAVVIPPTTFSWS